MEKKYVVYEDDNLHWEDESERDFIGTFDTLEEAIAVCVQIVDNSLRHHYRRGMTPEKLYDDYLDFGSDPFIRSNDKDCPFSARMYAKLRAKAICEEMVKKEIQ
jgi:hypothetical protein